MDCLHPLQVEYKQTAGLIPYARNARTHSEVQITQIASSIKEFGFINPVIIEPDGGIIAGHGRVLAAQLLQLERVPTISVAYLSEPQKRAYILADNKLAMNAGWDDELLRIELDELQSLGFDLEMIGFDAAELGDILASIDSVHGLIDDDDAPAVQSNPVSKPGDLWILGNHRLLCGDSTVMTDLERLCDGRLVDMWLTDPPYNVAYEGATKAKLKILNDSMPDGVFCQFLRDCYVAA